MPDPLQLMRLLQLASPALPVGAFAYSQGIEWQVEAGLLKSPESVALWLADVLEHGLGRFDLPIVALAFDAWAVDDTATAADLNQRLLAGRESSELRAETAQMGQALGKLAVELGLIPATHACRQWPEISFPVSYALAAERLQTDRADALAAFAYSWLENQVLAAVKTIPLGQAAGQRLLLDLATRIPATVAAASRRSVDDLENFLPGLALASAFHETQYTRLFRS